MNKPRDHYIVDRVGVVRTARLFSNIVSPPVMFAVLGLALALHQLPVLPALAWSAVYGFFASLAPILFVLYLLRTGRVAELHMSNTTERHLPYLVAVLGSALVYGLISAFSGPQLLRCLSLLNMVTLVLLGVINTMWLISFHTTAAMAMVTVVALVFGTVAGALLLPVVGLVVTVRLYLRRHTVAQVLGGLLMGVGAVYIATLFGCFV
jgi:membrane-associated phospholipid phosphatase